MIRTKMKLQKELSLIKLFTILSIQITQNIKNKNIWENVFGLLDARIDLQLFDYFNLSFNVIVMVILFDEFVSRFEVKHPTKHIKMKLI